MCFFTSSLLFDEAIYSAVQDHHNSPHGVFRWYSCQIDINFNVGIVHRGANVTPGQSDPGEASVRSPGVNPARE